MDVVITTIFPPTAGARALSEGLAHADGTLWVMGDRPGPAAYDLPHVRFYSLAEQTKLPFALARELPEKHYTRKNLGYLLALQQGATALVETDDDNIPLASFWSPRQAKLDARRVTTAGWVNAYRAFTKAKIWPRGLPLEYFHSTGEPAVSAASEARECLIQQALANDNPDVDAVYRLTCELPVKFDSAPPISLARGSWCPFNSQNTTFFPAAYPLLYLPSYCTFRMTDIWRSFVAQRCLWEMDSELAFTEATVYQERNEHNLLRDFEQEVPGYLNNHRIREALESLTLQRGRAKDVVIQNQRQCYEKLVEVGVLPMKELSLLTAWNSDVRELLA